MNWIRSLALACVVMLGLPLSAQAATQVIFGDSAAVPPVSPPSDPPRPLSIWVGDTGSLQSKRGLAADNFAGMFFGSSSAPAANFWHLRVKGAPANDVTFGPRDTIPVTDSNVLDPAGAWTAAAPARVDTVMRVRHAGVDLFEVRQTVLYVARDLSYRVVWNIRNITPAQTIPFIFGTSADLFIESDAGEGVLIDGPSRFLGGRNKFTGATGGIQEVVSSQLPGEAAATPIPRWASYEEGDPFPVTRRLSTADAFLNTINPLFMDNGVGVSFDDRAMTGLAAGATARYEVIWHYSRPTALTAAARDEASAPSDATPPLAEASDVSGADSAAVASAGGAAGAGASGGAAVRGEMTATAAAGDSTAPVLSALRLSPKTFGASKAASRAKIAFRLSERANVVLRIVRRTKGRAVTVTTLTRSNLAAGSNAIALGRRIGARRLVPGRYLVSARATDAAGNRGAQRSASFRIVSR